MAFRKAFERYIDEFDGTEKDFVNVEKLFDRLYCDDSCMRTRHSRTLSRDEMKQLHARYLSLRTKATVLDFKYSVGNSSVHIKIQLVNEREDIVVHHVASIKDDKFHSVCEIHDGRASTIKARGIGYYYHWKCRRSAAHFVASSSARSARPRQVAATCRRVAPSH